MKQTRIFTLIGSLVLVAGLVYGITQISVGQESAKADAWEVRCNEDEEGNKTYCEMFTAAVVKESGALVSEIAIGYPAELEGKARGAITLPLGMLLPPGGKMRVDEGDVFSFDMLRCTNRGCHSLIDLTPEIIATMEKGGNITLAFNLGGKNINLPMPLKGFKRAHDKLKISQE